MDRLGEFPLLTDICPAVKAMATATERKNVSGHTDRTEVTTKKECSFVRNSLASNT